VVRIVFDVLVSAISPYFINLNITRAMNSSGPLYQ